MGVYLIGFVAGFCVPFALSAGFRLIKKMASKRNGVERFDASCSYLLRLIEVHGHPDLTGASLSGADLRGASLSGADLRVNR